VAVGGDPGLDIALPLYSVVLVVMGIGLAKHQTHQRQRVEPARV
jgi:hypothetical protein